MFMGWSVGATWKREMSPFLDLYPLGVLLGDGVCSEPIRSHPDPPETQCRCVGDGMSVGTGISSGFRFQVFQAKQEGEA